MTYHLVILQILQRTAVIYIGIFAGFIFIKSPLQRFRTQFIFITINVFTPLLILLSLLELNFDNWYIPVLGAVIVTVVGVYIPKILSQVHSLDHPTPAELCTATFPNALNFPFPIIFAFAPEGLGVAGIFLAVSILTRNTVGFKISGVAFDKKGIKEILLFPPVWAIIVGLLFRFILGNGTDVSFNQGLIDIVLDVGIFATLMTVGFSLQLPNLEFKLPMYRVGLTRFVVSGIFALLIVVVLQLERIVGIPLIVQMIAPPAVYNGLYAERFGLDTELTTQLIVTLTIVALILLPLELLLIEAYW